MYILDLDFEVGKLESTEGVDSAQVSTRTLHKDWLDIESVDVSVQKNLSNLFSSGRTQKERLEIERSMQVRKASEAFKKYYGQGEPRKGDHQADLTRFARFNISSESTSTATMPRTTPQLNPGPSAGQTINVVRPSLD